MFPTKKNKIELFKNDNALWIKNESFGDKFEYIGHNTFEYAGMPSGMYWKLYFELMPSGVVQLTNSYIDDNLVKHTSVSLKGN